MHENPKQHFSNALPLNPALYSWPFMLSVFLLIINDAILKSAFPNIFTGKLSDFCGLYAFAFFFSQLFPVSKKLILHVAIGLLFILWKSPLSESFIIYFSKLFFTINRVVDYSDLWALIVLPISYFKKGKSFDSFYKTIGLSLIALIAFTATSQSRPRFHFFEPQYILLKNTNPVFILSEFGNHDNKSIKVDSLMLVRIIEVSLDRHPELYDDFEQKALLENLEKSILYEPDSLRKLVADKSVSSQDFYKKQITLEYKVDSCVEKLSFLNGRLNGSYSRYINQQAIVSGYYKNGIPDSVWTYYTFSGSVDKKDIYENGEKIKSIQYDGDESTSSSFVLTRWNKKIIAIIIFAAMILTLLITSYFLWKEFKKAIHKPSIIERILNPILSTVLAIILTYFLQAIMPGSDMFNAMFLQIVFLIVGCPVFFIIYFAIDKHSMSTFLLIIFLYCLLIMLVHDFNFISHLKNISEIK